MSKGYGQYCPIARTLELLGDKWTLLVVRELMRGKRRFKDIESGLPGIPPNLLSDRLKVLEQAQLVTRQYFRELPPRVEYSLTERGASLDVILESIAGWGASHLMEGDLPCRVEPDLFFFNLPRFFCPEKAGDLSATIEVALTGEGGGSWFVCLEKGACTVSRTATSPVTATIRSDVQTWGDLMALHREPDSLSHSAAVQFEGDVSLGREFASFFCKRSAGATEHTGTVAEGRELAAAASGAAAGCDCG